MMLYTTAAFFLACTAVHMHEMTEQLVDQEYTCRDGGCEIAFHNLVQEKKNEPFYEPINRHCYFRKHHDRHFQRELRHVRNHDWPRFIVQVNRNNRDAPKVYIKMSNRMETRSPMLQANVIPFTEDKLERRRLSFCRYLRTYFKTIRQGIFGRRHLVKRRSFEDKFDSLTFFDPLRMKLSFDPPPVRDYSTHKFYQELFMTQNTRGNLSSAQSLCKGDTNVHPCRVCHSQMCPVWNNKSATMDCFIAMYYDVVCSGECVCACDSEKSCQTTCVSLKTDYPCFPTPASVVLQQNVRDKKSGILEESVPRSLEIPTQIEQGSCSLGDKQMCHRAGFDPGSKLVSLYLPLCCVCNCINC